MAVIAVVGGTGNVGRTIVDALKQDGKHEVIVLTRKTQDGANAALAHAVDYNNIDQVIEILDANNVHTIISTILMLDPVAAQSELNMIAAAAKSSSTKRFVASNWGLASPPDEYLKLPFNALRDRSIEALRKTDLEWTQFHCGFFLDYYGIPHVESYLTPLVFAVDIGNKKAAIPGATGDETITFTYTRDLGKFVVAALSLPKWDEALHCYSENTTLGQLVQVAEEATGSKFDVTYDSVEKLERGEITELPSHPYAYPFFPKALMMQLLSRFGLWVVKDLMWVPQEGSLNEKFPDITTTSVKDIVGAWKGK